MSGPGGNSRWLPVLVTAALAVGAAEGQGTTIQRAAREGQPVPEFSVTTLGGKKIDRAGLAGQAFVVCFVRPGQKRSEKALRALGQLHRELSPKGLRVLAVASGPRAEEPMRELTKRQGFKFAVAIDPARKAYGAFEVVVSPTTFVAGKDGVVKQVLKLVGHRHLQRLRAHARLALGLIDRKEHDRQLAAEERPASRADPHFRRLALARTLFERGRMRLALKQLEKLHADRPQDPEAALLLARTHLALGKTGKAEELLVGLAKSHPGRNDVALSLGRLRLAQARLADARAVLEALLERMPGDPGALYELGRVHERQGDLKRAAARYREAFEKLLEQRNTRRRRAPR